ncbi:MAG: SIMPL domain-containing protein [Flavobacteriales bacterium]|nr:SIMPL domain-containing protein [Flavobacteriales bacterium]
MHRHPLLIPSLAAVLAVTILASACLVALNGRYFFPSQASDIAVTGSTSVDFTSDLAVWQGQFTRKATDLKEVYALMKQDKAVVEAFLTGKGIPQEAYSFLSIDIIPQNKTVNHYNDEGDLVDREQVFNGYRLRRDFKVTSNDIDLVERLANEVTELIEQDVYITSYPPKYYYTQLGELKIQMIEAASQDGQLRARTAVQGGGGELGDLLETSIGVFQILGTNSDESFSWGGTLNTSSKLKTAFVNVKQRYAIE